MDDDENAHGRTLIPCCSRRPESEMYLAPGMYNYNTPFVLFNVLSVFENSIEFFIRIRISRFEYLCVRIVFSSDESRCRP